MNTDRAWPVGITIFLILFAATIVVAGIWISRIQYDLVHPDYYARELDYETQLDSIRRARALDARPTVEVSERTFVVTMPASSTSRVSDVKLHLYYPADKAQDLHANLDFSAGTTVRIPLGERPGGNWRAFLQWQQDGAACAIDQRARVPQ